MAMSKKKRIPRTTIFIACEGSNTEPIYFERIKEKVEDSNLLAITIYPDQSEENPKTHALGLVEVARNRIDDFDEVWAVFDKNGYTKHEEAFALANRKINGKKVNIAFSSIAFEHWVLLHFEKNNTAYEKSKHIEDNKFKTNETYYPDYSKRATVDIYPMLQSRTKTAIQNASWLRFRQKNELETKPIYEINPYTDVDVLVRRLLDIEEVIEWSGIGERLDFKKVQVMLNLENNDLRAEIYNCHSALLISIQLAFSTIHSDATEIQLQVEQQRIEANQALAIILCQRAEDVCLIKVVFEAKTYFVEL